MAFHTGNRTLVIVIISIGHNIRTTVRAKNADHLSPLFLATDVIDKSFLPLAMVATGCGFTPRSDKVAILEA
ncbi:MAG: hypothetical protein OK457_05715 [Thaumarchaeota archaeon]|nr:hypothetical protein [Nitrososphaerota archaeon]